MEKAVPMSAMKVHFQIAECSPLYQKKKDGMILEPYASFTIFQRNKLLPMIYLLHILFGSLINL